MAEPEAPSAAAPVYRPRSGKDWEDNKVHIKQLYWIEGKDLPTVIRLMRDKHGFLATWVLRLPLVVVSSKDCTGPGRGVLHA